MTDAINPAAADAAYPQAAKMVGGARRPRRRSAQRARRRRPFSDLLTGVIDAVSKAGRAAETKAVAWRQGKGDLVDVVTAVERGRDDARNRRRHPRQRDRRLSRHHAYADLTASPGQGDDEGEKFA